MKKKYEYETLIVAKIDTRGIKSGSSEVEKGLTRAEKQAQKMAAAVKKAFAELDKIGFNSAKLEAAQSRIIVADEKALRAIRSSEQQKILLTEKTRQAQIKTSEDTKKAAERAADAQVRAAQRARREEEYLFQSRAKFDLDEKLRIERYDQARFRSMQMIARESERQQKAELRRNNELQRSRDRISNRKISEAADIDARIGTVAQGAAIGAAALVAGGIYSIVKAGAEYEQSQNLFQAVTRASAAEMEAASKKAKELGADVKLPATSAKDASLAMTELAKANFTAKEAMDAARGTLLLAAAGQLEEAKAAEITANALNSFHLAATESIRVSDLLAASANASSAEVSEIAQSMQQASAIAYGAKIPIEDLATAIALMANAGVKGSDAGTSLKTFIQRLQSPTDVAAASLEQLSIKIYDIDGRMKPLPKLVGEFDKALSGLSDQDKANAINTIFGADASRAAQILFSTGIEGFEKMKSAVTVTGAAAELAAAKTKGLAGTWEAFKSQLETSGLDAFESLGPLLTVGLGAALSLLQIIVKYPAAFGAAAVALGGLALAQAAYNSQLIVSATTAIPQLINNLRNLIVIMTSFSQVSALSATGLAAFTLGWGALITAVGLAAYAIYSYSKAQEKTTEDLVKGVEASNASINALNQQRETLNNLGTDVGSLSGNQQKLTDIYGTLNAASLERVNSATKEKGAVGALAEEVERLNKAKGLELEVKVIEIAERTAKAYETQRVAVARAEEASKQYQNSIGNLNNVMEVNAKTGLETGNVAMTVKQQYDQLGQRQTQTADEARRTTEEFNQLKTALDAGAKATGMTTVQFIEAKVATGQMTRQTADFMKALDATAAVQGTFSGKMNTATDVINDQANAVKNLRDQLKGLISESQANIDEKIASIALTSRNKAEAIQAAKIIKAFDLQVMMDLNQIKRLTETEKAAREVFQPSESSTRRTRTRTPNPEADFRRENRVKTGNAQWDKFVYEFSSKYGVDSDLIFAQMMQESSFKKGAVSNKGASGLMQLMPATARRFGVKDIFDPRQNIEGGVKYMRFLLDKFGGNTALALAGYNAGEGAVMKYGGIPPYKETQDYVKRISANYGKVKGKAEVGGNFDYEKSIAEISDNRTKEFRDGKTLAAIDSARLFNVMPDPEVIRNYNEILVEQAKKTGEIQPELEDTIALFKGLRDDPGVSDQITTRELSGRDKFFLNLDQSLNLTKRKTELDERRLYLADELLLKENDYILALQEAQTDLQVEAKLLEKRNLSFEAANEFTRQQNAQIREMGDVEIALDVLRRQNADDQFVEQRRLLSAKSEQLSIEQEISVLQDKVANAGINDDLEIQAAHLRDILNLRRRETDAIIASNRAQTEISQKMKISNNEIRAQVLDNLASQPSINDAIASGINKLFDQTADAIDKQFDKIGVGKIPIIGDILKAQSRNILSKLTNDLLDVFLPERSTGNPVLDENKQQTKYLKSIDAKLGGGVSSLGNTAGGGISAGSSGGSIWDVLKNIFTGGRGGGSNSASTPPFVGNSMNSGSGNRTGDIVNDVMQVIAGDKGRDDLWSNLKYAFSGKDGSLLGKGGIFGKDGFGFNSGTMSTIGAGATMLGGFISERFGGSAVGRRLGGALSYAGTGMSIGSMFGPWGAAIGAGIGAIFGFFASGGQRKKDEKTRNQGMMDALGAIDKLIAQVNSDPDFTDVTGIVNQGAAIKQNYLDSMSQLKDNKTRNIALKDASRIEAKLRELETLAKAKASKTKSRAEALQMDVPTFADGGAISNFARQNFPNGLISGPGSARSDSILARISNGEYILDAATVKNIGIANLDAIRASQGRMLKYMSEPIQKFADGGAVGMMSGNSSGFGGINVDVNCKTVIDLDAGTATTTSEVDVTTPYGSEKTVKTVVEDINRKGEDSEIVKALSRVRKNK